MTGVSAELLGVRPPRGLHHRGGEEGDEGGGAGGGSGGRWPRRTEGRGLREIEVVDGGGGE